MQDKAGGRFLFIIIPVLLASILLAAHAEASRLTIVLDADDYRQAVTDDKTRFEMAVYSMRDFLSRNRGIFDDVRLIFLREEGCKKSKKVVSLSPEERNAAYEKLSIARNGRGLISSLGKELSRLNKDTDVLLYISNGTPSCADAPCAKFKRELPADKREAIVIVGMFVPALKEMEQLKCMASATGGVYFNVTDESSLSEALSTIEKRIAYNLEVNVIGFNGKVVRDYIRTRYGYDWEAQVFRRGAKEPLTSTHLFPARFYLPGGSYDVKIRLKNSERWIRNLKVVEGRRATEKISFETGSVGIKVFSSGQEVMGARRHPKVQWGCEAFESKTGEKAGYTETFPVELDLFPGVYDLRIFYFGKEKWLKGIVVEVGETSWHEVRFP